jgi:hypothetical protein
MLVHHSRNSAQKQWDETLVLVLTGMGRLLRTYLPILASLPRMDKGWQEIMQMVESTLVRVMGITHVLPPPWAVVQHLLP